MTNRDIFDILRDGDRAVHHALPDANSPLARSIRATVMANTHTVATTRRRRAVIVVAAVLTALLATAAVWVVSNRDTNVTNPSGILCYDAPGLDANAILAPRDREATTDACTSLWRDELLPVDITLPTNHDQPLVGCVTAQGNLAVFPSTNHGLCADLGLADLVDATGPDPRVELSARLIEAINPQTCLTIERAQQVAHEELDALGIKDWTVVTQDERPDRPCATISIDATNNTIHLVPFPRTEPN